MTTVIICISFSLVFAFVVLTVQKLKVCAPYPLFELQVIVQSRLSLKTKLKQSQTESSTLDVLVGRTIFQQDKTLTQPITNKFAVQYLRGHRYSLLA